MLTRSLLALSVILMLTACQQQKVQSMSAPPPVPVSVARAVQEAVPLEVRVVGTAEASSVVQVKSQVAGELTRVGFTEGQNVVRGALLFEIDPRPYTDALRQAEAALARDQAQLRQAEATLARDAAQAKNADTEAKRNDELASAGVISKTQHDQARTNADVYHESVRASQASLESMRAALDSDRAAVDRAKLDLSYCKITAPIAGRAGNLLVHPGNLVKANDVPLVVIHQITPMFLSFGVAEQYLGEIRRLSARRKLSVRAFPQDAPDRAAQGYVSVVDNTVDSATGTIRLKATFDNRDGLLWPGQFANVVLSLDTQQNAIVVPAEAVQEGQQGQFVYVVKADQTVEPRVITPGRTIERKTVVARGLNAGETIVTDGQLRLAPGARIQAVDARRIESGKL